MAIENDFLPFAVGAGANVLTQSAYAALAAISTGYQAGTAQSAALNKTWRQSSIIAAVIAQFIVAETGQPAIDDGTTATLLANLTSAIQAASQNSGDSRYAQISQLYGVLKGIATFTSSGTWTSPITGTAYITGCAGGGGGGPSPGAAANQTIGGCGGGGAGQSVVKFAISVTKGQSYAITIGAAGASGNAGGNSSFGTLLTLTGGSPGSSATAGVATSYLAGAIGGAGYPYGSFGDDTGPVGAGGVSGFGASSPFGGGGGQVRGVIAGTPLIAGLGASGYGGGGGGAGGNYPGGSTSFASSAAAPGGGGAPGLLIVEW